MTRTRGVILGVLVLIAIVLAVWWRSSGGRTKPAPAPGAADEVAARDDSAAGPRRSIGGDRRAAPVKREGDVVVEGKVVDAAGAPVGGVDVIFGGKVDATATSGADGVFVIALPPRSYEVRAIGERLYATSRTVEVGTSDAPLVIEVSELASARGWVIDASGKPVVGATVAASVARKIAGAVEKDGLLPSATTDGNGVFEIDLLPGFDRLTADHPTAGHGHTNLKDVPAGEREEDVRIQLAPYAALHGVVRSPDGVGMAGAEVTVTVRETAFRRLLSTTTGEDGAFVFAEAVPGDLTIDARLAGYAAAEPQHVKIVAGEAPAAVTLTLSVPVTLTGRVADADGEPVDNAKVKVQRDGSDVPFHATRTEGDGSFEVTGLDAGPHTVTVEVGGRARLSRKLTAIPAAPVDLQLDP